MAERFTAEELLNMLDSCDRSRSDESDFEDDRMFSYLGTSTGVVVAPVDSEESTSMVALENEHSTAMLEDSLDSLSDGVSQSCIPSKSALLLHTFCYCFYGKKTSWKLFV